MKSFEVVNTATWDIELLVGVDKYSVAWVVTTSRRTGFSTADLQVVKNNFLLDLDSSEAQNFARTARFLRMQQLKTEYHSSADLDKLFSHEYYEEVIISLVRRSFNHEYVGQSCGEHLTVQDLAEFFTCSSDAMHDDLDNLAVMFEYFTIINDVVVPYE